MVFSSGMVFSVNSAKFIRPSRGASTTASRAIAFVSFISFPSLLASLAASVAWRWDGIAFLPPSLSRTLRDPTPSGFLILSTCFSLDLS